MIDFEHVWLPQIVSYAKMISTGQVKDEWLGRSSITTSVTDPDELHEQIFDDLDAQGIWSEARERVKMPASAIDAIDSFLAALLDIDGRQAAKVVASDVWAKVEQAAGAVVASVR